MARSDSRETRRIDGDVGPEYFIEVEFPEIVKSLRAVAACKDIKIFVVIGQS